MSVVILTSLFAYLALEVASRATRYVIEGSFDVNQNGDVIEEGTSSEYHWKRIHVPQLTLENMPLIQVCVKTNDRDSYTPSDKWKDVYVAHGILPTSSVVYDEQSVLILYKRVETYQGIPEYFFNGEYKVIVIK